MLIPIMGTEIVLNDDPELESVGLTIFFSGCFHACPKCHNPESWDVRNGNILHIDELKNKIKDASPLIKTVCFCGGEPLLYPEAVQSLSKFCKSLKLKTVLYTGYEIKNINQSIFDDIDIVIDGKYVDELSTKRFPASENQKVFINKKELSKQEILKLPINKLNYKELNDVKI